MYLRLYLNTVVPIICYYVLILFYLRDLTSGHFSYIIFAYSAPSAENKELHCSPFKFWIIYSCFYLRCRIGLCNLSTNVQQCLFTIS